MKESRSVRQMANELVLVWSLTRHLATTTQVLSSDFDSRSPVTNRALHSYMVENTGRNLAKVTDADVEVVRLGCLLHDVGHPPFGHAGEHALNEIMEEVGLNFDHNTRTLELLSEHGAPLEVIEALKDEEGITNEGKVIDLADDITWTSTDLAEGVIVGILDPDGPEFHKLRAYQAASRKVPELALPITDFGDQGWLNMALILRDLFIDDIAERYEKEQVIDFSPPMRETFEELRDFLYTYFYHSPPVDRMWDRAHEVLHKTFDAFFENPDQLPPDRRNAKDKKDKTRIVVEYISSLSEAELMIWYEQFFGKNSWIKI